jgi:acylphosphatase
VQGVGFRYFVERAAEELGIDGYTRNLDDGRVEVYAIGSPDKLSELAGLLWKGPRWSEVRGVEEQEAPMLQLSGFQIRY